MEYSSVIVFLFALQSYQIDRNLNTQTLSCDYDIWDGGVWYPKVIPCEPITCQSLSSPNGSKLEIIFSPEITNRQYETHLLFRCPENGTLPDILKSNFSFDYNLQFGFVYNISAFCDIDG